MTNSKTVNVTDPPVDGYVPIWNNASQSWNHGQPSATVNWVTALDLSFKNQPNQSLAGDGNKTIAGLTWTKLNSANELSAMTITNGSGLIITPNSASNIGGSTFSSPTIRIPMLSILPIYTIFMPIRIWMYVSTDNAAANFDGSIVGIYIPNTGYANQYTAIMYKGFAGAQNGWGGEIVVLNSTIIFTSPAVPQSTNKVGLLAFPGGAFGGFTTILTGTTAAVNWPDFNTMQLSASPCITSSSSGAFSSTASGNHAVSEMNFLITAYRSGSGTAFSTTIERIRIDYLPFGY